MESKKLKISVLFDGIWQFVKEQFKRLDSWAVITFLSYLGSMSLTTIGCIFLFLACAGLIVIAGVLFTSFSYLIAATSVVYSLAQHSYFSIIAILAVVLFLFIAFKLLKKAVGFGNCMMLNVLAAVENRTLPRFSIRDESLRYLGYFLTFFFLFFLGIIFLIVPGIIFLVRCSMGYMIMLEQKCSISDALKKSWHMTEGNFWPIFVFFVPMLCIGSIPWVGILFCFVPLNLWVQGYIYHQLKQQTLAELTD